MNIRYTLIAFSAAIGLLSSSYYCYSALTDSQTQRFRVTVPARVSIVAPAIIPLRTYFLGNANLAFPRQNWVVRGNVATGTTVTLQTATSFHHNSEPTMRRDGRLSLRVNSQAGVGTWVVTRASDTTDYLAGDEDAMVQVVSDKSGEAELGLGVTFLTGIGAELQEGDYSLTVVGTITSN